MLRFTRHPHGWRCHLARRRVHHGLAGAALCVAGIVMMLDDRKDWPWRFAVELDT
jgi:hypothetical protein